MTTTIVRLSLSAALMATGAISGTAYADTNGEVAKFDARTNTYCVNALMIGSMIPHRICATRQEWLDRGATLVAKPHKQLAAQ